MTAGKSVLLIGPRQTGKSTLVHCLSPELEFNLAHQSTFLEFAKDPKYLEDRLHARLPSGGIVFIDEIQRISGVLNTVQYLIDKKMGYQFVLTGSSARKLRRGKANLLPGRVHSYEMGPITAKEVNYSANTETFLSFGSLPEVITTTDSTQKKRLLKSYATTYLNEEIKAEALTKNVEGFARFLYAVTADSTKYLDLSKISNLAAVPRQTTQRFFEILEDTLLVRRLGAFAKSEKRRLIQHPRFFLFDNGVFNGLLGNFRVSDDRKGQLFENLFVNQLALSLSNSGLDYRLSNYRTDAGAEVDLILELDERVLAIEIKSGAFSRADFSGLTSFHKYLGKKCERFIVIPDGVEKKMDDVRVLPWQKFLSSLKI